MLTEPILPEQGAAFCDIAKPIPNSKENLQASRQGIDENNLYGVYHCGW